MAKKAVKQVVVGSELTKISKRDLENAAEDARYLMQESAIIRSLVGVDIVSRRLYMLVRGALEREIHDGWEIRNPQLVLQTLVMSAQDKANDKFTALELQQQLLESVIPVVDIFVMQEREDQATADEATQDQQHESESGDPVPESTDSDVP